MKKSVAIALSLLMIFGSWGCTVDLHQGGNPAPSSNVPSEVPLSWAGLNLTGRLIYLCLTNNTNNAVLTIQALNLATGKISTIFTAPDNSGIYYVTVAPDGSQLVMSYLPPSQGNSLGIQALYIMRLDGTEQPQLLFTPPTQYDQYIQVEWSPDAKYIYYVHNNYHDQPDAQIFPHYEIFRMAYPDGAPEKIADNAFWPRLSPDSSRLVYVTLDPVTGKNELLIANADGSNAAQIKLYGTRVQGIKDAPLFSPDGGTIFFSAPSPAQSYQPTWLDKLTGVQLARAHNVPSDWWSVPIAGGMPARLTQIQSTSLFGAVSPDAKYIASFSGKGLFVMGLDGLNLTMLIPDLGGIPGTVNWIKGE